MRDESLSEISNKALNKEAILSLLGQEIVLYQKVLKQLNNTIDKLHSMHASSDKSTFDVRLKEVKNVRDMVRVLYIPENDKKLFVSLTHLKNSAYIGVGRAADYLSQISNSPHVKIGSSSSVVTDVSVSKNLSNIILELKAAKKTIETISSKISGVN